MYSRHYFQTEFCTLFNIHTNTPYFTYDCDNCRLTMYRIAGKFGGNYIWRNGLQAAKNKYWRNLNLAIGNRAYKVLLRHLVSYGGSPHVVRLKCEDRSRSHGRVSTRELCSRPSHIQEYVDSVVEGSTFCGFAASRSMLRLTLVFAFSRSFCVGVDDSHVIFLGSVGPSCKKKLVQSHSVFTRSDFTSRSFNG